MVDRFTYNLSIIQHLFDGMKELETVRIAGNLLSQSTGFVERNFECSKVKSFSLDIENFEYPGFFRKFPNLESFGYPFEEISSPMVESFAENCRQINYLWFHRLKNAFRKVIFPELVELHFAKAGGFKADVETFLARQPKLKILEMFGVEDKERVWKLPFLLPNLIEIKLHAELNDADLKKLLLSWKSIKKLTIVTDLGELDLKAVKRAIARDVVLQNLY
jgi:hypothetical protein